MVASYGGRDRQLVGAVPRLTAALEAHDVPHDVKVYPAAGHCFLNDAPNGPLLARPLLQLGHVGPDPAAAPTPGAASRPSSALHLAAPGGHDASDW